MPRPTVCRSVHYHDNEITLTPQHAVIIEVSVKAELQGKAMPLNNEDCYDVWLAVTPGPSFVSKMDLFTGPFNILFRGPVPFHVDAEVRYAADGAPVVPPSMFWTWPPRV
jgi:hypothetical protein